MDGAANSATCIEPDVALDFLDGRTPEHERARVIDHLAQCGTCRLMIAEMAKHIDSAPALAGTLSFAPTPTSAARFQIRARIGGTHGAVYRAFDRQRGIEVALKTLPRMEPRAFDRLEREFRAMRALMHPNLVRLEELVCDASACFFTMELVDGVDVLTWARGRPDLVRPAFHQLAVALGALHSANKVHGDLDSSKVLVKRDGSVVVLDANLDARTGSAEHDWYSVGNLLHHALSGADPSAVDPDLAALARELLADPSHRPHGNTVIARLARDLRATYTIAGRYRLEAEIGRGGMATVYSATHLATQRRLAVKLLRAGAADHEERRFLREARISARVAHPNLADVFDVGTMDGGGMYLALELLEGETLAAHLQRKRAMRPQDALDTLVPILDALDALHSAGVVHRDVKPSNIFLSAESTGRVVPKLLDLGLSKHLDPTEAMTAAGAVLGTPCYMAPEQIAAANDVGVAADVWAIGVVLYETLSGERPFRGGTIAELFHKIRNEPAPRLAEKMPALPRSLADAVDHALAHEPSHRHRRAADLAEALVASAIEAGWVLTCRLPSGPQISVVHHKQAVPLVPSGDETLISPTHMELEEPPVQIAPTAAARVTPPYAHPSIPKVESLPARPRRSYTLFIAALVVLTITGATSLAIGIALLTS
jgi:eukaryotic-like serine/threonine-protein kinase